MAGAQRLRRHDFLSPDLEERGHSPLRTMTKPKKPLEIAGTVALAMGLLTIGAVACNVDVIAGDDGGGGQGGAPTTVAVTTGTTGYVASTVSGITVVSTVGSGTAVVSTGDGVTVGGGCPTEPEWNGCQSTSSAVGSTAAGGADKYCKWQQNCTQGDDFLIECDGETGLCTCTGSDGSCSCGWEVPPEIGSCGTPCCGGMP